MSKESVQSVVTTEEMSAGIRSLGLSHTLLCVHSSLRSFGYVNGGAQALVDGLLAEECTILVPTFSSDAYEVMPPPEVILSKEGLIGDEPTEVTPGVERVYSPDSCEIDKDMGSVSEVVLSTIGRVRSLHPIRSFAAIGARAGDLIPQDANRDLFGPLEKLSVSGGSVLLVGVGLDKATAIHLAEQEAGRRMFRRWANGSDRRPISLEIGGCSDGFVRLDQILKSMERMTRVGQSVWRAYPASELLKVAKTAIQKDRTLTHCGDLQCIRCDVSVTGGPAPWASEDQS